MLFAKRIWALLISVFCLLLNFMAASNSFGDFQYHYELAWATFATSLVCAFCYRRIQDRRERASFVYQSEFRPHKKKRVLDTPLLALIISCVIGTTVGIVNNWKFTGPGIVRPMTVTGIYNIRAAEYMIMKDIHGSYSLPVPRRFDSVRRVGMSLDVEFKKGVLGLMAISHVSMMKE